MTRLVDSRVLADPARGDGHAADGTPGDCLRACLATVLGVAYEDVTHIAQHRSWEVELRRAALAHGWDVGMLDPPYFPVYLPQVSSPRYVIASGPSPRGPWLHSVVVDQATGDLVHDPHPSRAGLAGPPVDLLVLIEPGVLTPLPVLAAISAAEAPPPG